jgi:hypothetical protein
MTWYKENSDHVKFMSLDEFDEMFSQHLNSFDFLLDVQNIMQSKYPQYKKWMTPIDMDTKAKALVADQLPSKGILGFILPSEPLLTAAIFLALFKRLYPRTMISAGFSFDMNPEFFSKSSYLHPQIKEHGKYSFLISSEADGMVIDFLVFYETNQ